MCFSNHIHQQSLIRDEIANHSSPLDVVSSPVAPPTATGALSSSGGTSSSTLRTSIDAISTTISSLSVKLNAELIQLNNFESIVSDQYREGEQAQRNINKLLVTSYAGLPSSTSDASKLGPLSASQIRVGGNGQSLNEKIYLPSAYHWAKLQEFVSSIHALTTQVGVVEEYLLSQQSGQLSSLSSAAAVTPQSLTNILHAQHASLVAVSGRISTLHEQANAVRDRFVQLFGREGAKRLEEERKKEMKKREAFDLNAPNAVPLVSSTATPATGLAPTSNTTATAAATTTPATSGFGFGTTPTPSTGVAAPSSTGFGFGTTPAATTTAPSSTGFGFGTTPAATTTTPATGTGGFGFGATTAPASTGFGFGTTPSTGFGFGSTTPSKSPSLTRQTSVSGRKK